MRIIFKTRKKTHDILFKAKNHIKHT